MAERVWIGLDPGTHCGYAALDSRGECVASGVWDLSPHRHEGAGFRFLRLERWLGDLLRAYKAEGCEIALAYEEVHRHKGTDAAHVYGGVVAIIQRVCEIEKIPYAGIPVGAVKKHATGKGNADKEMMVNAAQERWKQELKDDNEADALWIADALREGLA